MPVEPTTQPAAAAGTVRLGDLIVNRMGFGAMRLTGPGVIGEPADPENSLAVLRRAVELGVNFIDTAASYGPEINEHQIAQALHPYPDGLVIATKGGLIHERHGEWIRDGRPETLRASCEASLRRLRVDRIHERHGEWIRDGRPETLRASCEASLRRLRVDRIDLYQLHSVDSIVPIEESVGTLADLEREGKIRHIGLSNVDARQLAQARQVAAIVSVQNRYNLVDRYSEGVLEACERDGIAFVPWFPLGFGNLTSGGGRLADLAASRSATQAQIALAWLLRRSPVMLPIPGTHLLPHLEDNVAAAALELTDAEFAELSRAAGAVL